MVERDDRQKLAIVGRVVRVTLDRAGRGGSFELQFLPDQETTPSNQFQIAHQRVVELTHLAAEYLPVGVDHPDRKGGGRITAVQWV